MKRVQQGFTLIELMIVVAIIGILAAVAIPQYQDYTKKAKMGNALTAVDSLKTAIGVCAQETGDITKCDGGDNGIAAATDFTATAEMKSITSITDGVITAVTGDNMGGTNVNGSTLTFTPDVGTTGMTWQVCPSFTTDQEPAVYAAVTKNNVKTCASGGGSGGGTGT